MYVCMLYLLDTVKIILSALVWYLLAHIYWVLYLLQCMVVLFLTFNILIPVFAPICSMLLKSKWQNQVTRAKNNQLLYIGIARPTLKRKKIPTYIPYFSSAHYVNVTLNCFWPNLSVLDVLHKSRIHFVK